MVLAKLFHAIADKIRKPPALEGDFNFIEIEHPEFSFTRVPQEEHGLPCVKSMSPLGEIYVCALPKETKESPEFKAVTYICSEFEYGGKKGKYCSQPCLEPKLGRHETAMLTKVSRGKVRVEEESIMTPLATEAHSQIIEIKEFLMGEDYERTVGENLMASYESNLRKFIEDVGLCHPDNEKESNSFLRAIWKHLEKFLGGKKLAEVGRKTPYSCNTIVGGYPGFVTAGAQPWSYFVDIASLIWNPYYDTKEAAERYFELLRQRMEVNISKITARDIARLDLDFELALNDIYYDLVEHLEEELYELPCEDLAEEGIVWDEDCERKRELEKWLEMMEKHKPIPGMEEEFEEAKRRYKRELEEVEQSISESIRKYVTDEADREMDAYMGMTYEELTERAAGDWLARRLREVIGDYCDKKPQVCQQAVMMAEEES